MLGLNDVQLKNTRFYQEIAEEERLEGMQIGLQAGKQEGRQEGRQEAESLVLQRLLVKRFGVLPKDKKAAIAVASSEQLEIWLDRVLDAESLESVFS